MNHLKLIDELLHELSYRVGIVDIYNKEQQSLMSEILTEWGEFEAKQKIFNFLNEEEDGKRFNNPILNKKITYKTKDGKEEEGLVGNLITSPKDSPGRIEAEKLLSNLSDEEREELNKEIGSQGGGGPQDGQDGGEQSTDDETEQNKRKFASDPSVQKQVEKEKETREKIENEEGEISNDNETKEVKSFDTITKSPDIGKVTDVDDEYSDGEIKQKGLEIGYKELEGFKPAPGNAGSMLSEIMSGEGFYHLNENPNLTDEELTEKIYNQVSETELGKQNSGSKVATSKSRTIPEGMNVDLWNKCKSISSSAKTKFNENQKSISKLQSEGKISEPVKVRNFYGHEISIKKQVELIESLPGPFYTKEGIEVPNQVLVDLIKQSGGGENPSDTSTISIDKIGRALVTFHSDKLSTADIQANSTPNMEYEQAKEIVEKSTLSNIDKSDATQTIEEGQRKLEEKEQQLKSAANGPAKQMSNSNISQILSDIKSDKGIDSKAKVSSHLTKSIISRGKPHPSIVKYLPEKDGSYTEEELLKAFYEYMGDEDKESEPTESQLKLLYRSAKQNGYDISSNLGRIREESLEVQRDTHKKLNEKSIILPNGKQIPLGDYIEGQNLIEKLHLNVMDGEKNEKGVGKYPGLFNLNMGGTLVEAQQLKECINVDDTDDFIENFEVGTPGDGEEVTKNTETGAITGRNIFVFAVTKGGKRIPIAFKTQRSKQGESGKLSTTYQWDTGIQNCFKSKQN